MRHRSMFGSSKFFLSCAKWVWGLYAPDCCGVHLLKGEAMDFPPTSKANSNSDAAINQWNITWWTHPKICLQENGINFKIPSRKDFKLDFWLRFSVLKEINMGFKPALSRNRFRIKISRLQSIVFQNSFQQEKKCQFEMFCRKAC